MNKAAKEKQKIHILDESIVAKIAAGEVVERPASALKELLENSIDAGATEIKIHIKSAGKRLIKVTDNGAGMGAEDAKLAFHQHATSKISSEEDLNSILTLGFRGEALSSIAAVAEISLDTSNSLESTQIEVKRGKIISKDGTIQKGTSIAIKNLFANIPARQKFLRSDATEYKHMTDIFLQHAVANPAIAFDFKNEEKTIYNLPSTEDLQVRIFDIWGSRIAKKLINVNFDGPTLQINGFVGHPEIARRDRTMQYITLNRRPINSNLISKAVEDAFHSAKPDINHPIFFLNIQIDPKSIDVNVHPRKMEVKFSNTREIYTSVEHAVERALSKNMQDTVKQSFGYTNEKTYVNQLEGKQLKERSVSYLKQSSRPNQAKPDKKLIQDSLDFTKTLLTPSQNDFSSKYQSSQFFNTFLIVEKDDKLLFLDQHAADERIKYEKILKRVEQGDAVPTQPMLIPQTIELQPAKYELLKEHLDKFSKIGLEIEPFGKNTIKLSAIPSILTKFDFEKFIDEVLELELIEIEKKQILHKIIATMACHGSIRAGRKMQQEEIAYMISELFKCDKPYSCPHGRPIIWELKKHEIEKNFKRTGFC